MQVERVQRWVMSALLLTVATIFSGGLAVLGGTVPDRGGSRPGLLVISLVVELLGILGVRVVHEKRLLTGWLLAAPAPALVGWYFLIQR